MSTVRLDLDLQGKLKRELYQFAVAKKGKIDEIRNPDIFGEPNMHQSGKITFNTDSDAKHAKQCIVNLFALKPPKKESDYITCIGPQITLTQKGIKRLKKKTTVQIKLTKTTPTISAPKPSQAGMLKPKERQPLQPIQLSATNHYSAQSTSTRQEQVPAVPGYDDLVISAFELEARGNAQRRAQADRDAAQKSAKAKRKAVEDEVPDIKALEAAQRQSMEREKAKAAEEARLKKEREEAFRSKKQQKEKEERTVPKAQPEIFTGRKLLDEVLRGYVSKSFFRHFNSNHTSTEIQALRLLGWAKLDQEITNADILKALGKKTRCCAFFQPHKVKVWENTALANASSATEVILVNLKKRVR